MTSLYHYRHSGLLVASALELPEWDSFACLPGEADVTIILSDEPCPDFPADGSLVEGDSLSFLIEGIGGWRIEDGSRITLFPLPGVAPSELRLFTLGSAWAALGYQRGFAMWHGSVVERGGRTALFCGDAGAGKSTMAAVLCAQGAKLIADDLSRVEPGECRPVVHPSSTRIKLWRPAIKHLGWQDRVIQRDYFREDKFHCALPDHAGGGDPQKLDAIIILEKADIPWLEPLSGASALKAVLQGTLYRPEMLEAMGQWGKQAALAAAIVANTQVYRLKRPKQFGDAERDRLLSDLI